jgi:O-antigen ligase
VIEIALLYQPTRMDGLVDASSFAIVIFLAATSLFQNSSAYKFYYRGESRLTGLWVNPNTYGLLMGTGLLLAVAHGIKKSFPVQSSLAGNCFPGVTFNHGASPLVLEQRRAFVLEIPILVASALLLLLGLIRSYSRGAWLATLGGATYLCWAYAQKSQIFLSSRRPGAFIIFSRIWNLRWSLLIATFAVGTLLLPRLSYSGYVLAKRTTSALNLNDFSSQNRLVATEGALQIIANNPALGVGWPGAAAQFAEFYAPAALSDPWSIILNDYLTLGMSLGLPGLVSFIALIWVSWNRTDGNGNSQSVGSASWIRMACRSAVFVMLIGCWFDGVLFRLVLAVPLFLFLGLIAQPIPWPNAERTGEQQAPF